MIDQLSKVEESIWGPAPPLLKHCWHPEPSPCRGQSWLAADDIAAFRHDGFLVKTGLLDPSSVVRAVERTWELLPFDRAAPDSWHGEVTDDCHAKDLSKRRGRLKYRESIRRESWVYDVLFSNPLVMGAAEDLMGAVARPHWLRGLYPIMPTPKRLHDIPDGHLDKHPFQLGLVGYLSDVEANGGAFTVWPGSHRQLWPHFRTRGTDWRHRDFAGVVANVMRSIESIRLPAPAGTVVFWHHRLLHAAGTNLSASVRHAILGDLARPDFDAEAAIEPGEDMWHDWRASAFSH